MCAERAQSALAEYQFLLESNLSTKQPVRKALIWGKFKETSKSLLSQTYTVAADPAKCIVWCLQHVKPKSAQTGKKMLLGTLRFFWNQLSTSNQVTSGSTLGLSQQPRWRHKQSEKRREERFQHSWSSNFLLIENAKLLLQKCVCVCILRGMGALQIHGVWGRELVPLSPCPPSWVFC